MMTTTNFCCQENHEFTLVEGAEPRDLIFSLTADLVLTHKGEVNGPMANGRA